MDKCPGRENNLRAKIVKCPNCGYGVEFFSDELKRLCPGCKIETLQEKLPTCIDWCKHAKECLGESLFEQIKVGPQKRK